MTAQSREVAVARCKSDMSLSLKSHVCSPLMFKNFLLIFDVSSIKLLSTDFPRAPKPLPREATIYFFPGIVLDPAMASFCKLPQNFAGCENQFVQCSRANVFQRSSAFPNSSSTRAKPSFEKAMLSRSYCSLDTGFCFLSGVPQRIRCPQM